MKIEMPQQDMKEEMTIIGVVALCICAMLILNGGASEIVSGGVGGLIGYLRGVQVGQSLPSATPPH